jgi:apolipoprotein D and lipocalin family protein
MRNFATLIFYAFFSTILLDACAGKSGNNNVPEPKKSVEITKYFGKWYEIARYHNWFEEDCTAPSAEYKWLDESEKIISITNSCIKDGEIDIADGKAKIVDNSTNAKLKVSFFGPFYLGDYWVLDHDDEYNWAIIGEPTGSYLWLLARTPKIEPKMLRQLVSEIAKLGYDTNMLIYPQQQD